MPIFNLMQQSSSTKGFISMCYAMLLGDFMDRFPSLTFEKWERDFGDIPEEQWEEALESVRLCSLQCCPTTVTIILS